jgi:hypothetical protein
MCVSFVGCSASLNIQSVTAVPLGARARSHQPTSVKRVSALTVYLVLRDGRLQKQKARQRTGRRAKLGIMDLSNFDLSQPANVIWQNPSPDRVRFSGHRRHFASVTNAVRFVMEDLTDLPQSTARIVTVAGNLAFEEIKVLYCRLPKNA